MPKTKVFISSTFVDLSEFRAHISQWLSGVFGLDLVIMETFGSDSAPPNINSVRRVRECDLFVGIYAHRYGTIDQSTGKSITELELDEAKRALSSGTIYEILLYFIDNNAPWLKEYIEENITAKNGLERIREKAKQHTYTLFKNKDDLLFFIIRDVYRRLIKHIGISPLIVRKVLLPPSKKLRYPIGMEFLTSEHRTYLIGRDNESKELFNQLVNESIVLLLGDSGVGKTSLIHAGLYHKATESGWRSIYTRPFGLPSSDIYYQIQTSVFEKQPNYKGSLVSLLAEVVAAVEEEKTLLIIDQFEDILITQNNREINQLISELRALRELTIPFLKVLISYRADLEGRLGGYWQQISGSPHGLARVYLGGIERKQVWVGIETVVKDLSIKIRLRDVEEKRIINDLLVASQSLGVPNVYPPYIQMLIDHIWSTSKKTEGIYQLDHYQTIGGTEGVIGGYLNRQLKYAQDSEGHIQTVLISLVRSYGVKAQRSINEIVADTGLDKLDCELALEKLIDLRLVRHFDHYYEISHDFIAKRIITEFVDSEERDFKRFRELLASKAAAYQTTQALLTSEEILMLFKYKERIIPNEQEARLLLSSWIKGKGPSLFWILNEEKTKIIEWLRGEESKKNLDRDEKISIVFLRRKLGETPLVDEDYLAFRSYQLSTEMTALILEDPLSIPKELAFSGLRHRREEVRDACKESIAQKIINGDWSWIEHLRKSNSDGRRQTYEALILRNDIPIPEEKGNNKRAIKEFSLLKKLASSESPSEVRKLYKELQQMRPPKRSLLFAKALKYIGEGRIKNLLKEVERLSKENASILLNAIRDKVKSNDFEIMLSTYRSWNSKEKDRYEALSHYMKAKALSTAILRSMSPEYLSRLRKTVKIMRLTSSSREIIMALLKYGNLSDLQLVLDRISTAEEKINFWNHTELGRTVAKQIEKTIKGIPKFLIDVLSRREFWEYLIRVERIKLSDRDLLPIKCVENRALYIRLTAYVIISTAEKKDEKHLLRLVNHEYSLLARAATIRLVRLFGENAIRKLSTKVDDSIKTGKATSLAESLRSAEIELYEIANLW